MRNLLRRVLVVVGAATALSCGTPKEPESIYTSIREADCTTPGKEVEATYSARDLGVQQCPAPPEWRLLLVSSDANTWIDIAGPGVTWSGERPIVYESPIGNFPNIDVSPALEWRRDRTERLTSLIFRVTAQDPQTPQTQRSMFYVVRLKPGTACVAGRVETSQEARALADSGKGC